MQDSSKRAYALKSPLPSEWTQRLSFIGLRVAIVAGTLAVACAVAEAQAPQTADQAANPNALQEVVVTGSHLQLADAATAVNLEVVTPADIQASGQTTVADYLRTISSTFGNNINESFSNSFAPGAAMVALRGLSGKDTLVLLNGRRITNYALFQNLSDSFVDLNVIPLSAIDHIEILKSGGSAIYGSDAIAGVINIILKTDTTEKGVYFGGALTTDGGAAERDANVRAGFGDFASQGYNVYVTGSVYKRDQLLFSQRQNTDGQNYTDLPDGILQYHIANQYQTTKTPFPTCGTNGLPGVVANGVDGNGCYYNDASQLSLLPEALRANFTATGNARISDTWTAYGDLFFSNEETNTAFTPASLTAGSYVANINTGTVSPVSNTLPAGNPSDQGGAPTRIIYGFQSVGPRNNETVSNTYRVTLGAKGTVGAWNIDAGYGHSENHVAYRQENAINASALQAEIADGAYNFLNPLATPAASAALSVPEAYTSVAKLDTLDATARTPLFDLPGGPANVALGGEWRAESVDDQPGVAEQEAIVLSTGATKVDASRTVLAGFAEFDFPLVDVLDLDVAAREERYSGAIGSNLRPQFRLRWQPVHELTFRASYADGFRAPSLAEASRSVSLANNTVIDPMDPQHRPTETIGFITGGNPNVKPEISKNLDFGVVISPTPHLDLSADYYNLFLYRVIGPNATSQEIIDDPSAYPGQLVRNPSGTILYAESLYTNQFEIHTTGVDFDAGYRIPLAAGNQLQFALDATTVLHFWVQQAGAWSDFVGSNGWDYLSPISGGGPVPRLKGSVSAGWQNQAFGAKATLRYEAGYQNSLTLIGYTTQQNIASFHAIDLNADYHGLKNWDFNLAIVNVLNRYPPYDSDYLLYGPTNTPYDAFTYDDLGRMIDFHANYSF